MSVNDCRLYLFSHAQLAPQQRDAARAEQLRVDSVENPEAQMWIQIGLKNLMRSGFLELPAFSLPSVFNINELSVFWNFRFWSQNLEVESCCEHFHKFCHGYSGNWVEPSNYGALELTTTPAACLCCWEEGEWHFAPKRLGLETFGTVFRCWSCHFQHVI